MAAWIDGEGLTYGQFRKADLAKPGTLIEVEGDRGTTERHLIGSINQLRGVCDDCTAFSHDSRVIRYRRLEDPDLSGVTVED